ncbi:hypothetical protein FEE95_16325 [Maribacter algarum]|uniref:Uncharacterized protein n=1 Tax=Maribacter algarum (ex Zhang et al. 2020) TaxID=2578118 RepID=A0A5S3PU27_9FLAO|nr:hypothetical protein [Maribacter algarum]TMM56190.1 hypothetical protein FEE95_16325 [Maribacter algarum]
MKTLYTYSLFTNDQGQSYIQFDLVNEHIEFLKDLLQILGMYNYQVITNQNVWKDGELHAELTATIGKISICIDSRKRIFLKSYDNQKDLMKVDTILEKFCAFRKISETPTEIISPISKLPEDLVPF